MFLLNKLVAISINLLVVPLMADNTTILASSLTTSFTNSFILLADPTLDEIEINPILVRAEGAVAVDALVRKAD